MSLFLIEAGTPVRLTGTNPITTGACQIIGFYVATTSSGTMNIKDGTASAGTTLSGTITPAAGTFHRFPAICGTAAYFTLVSGSLDLTFFVTS